MAIGSVRPSQALAEFGRSARVQAFFGAIAGNHATKGVLMTTASFSQQAIAYAGTVDGVVLVDGTTLADLMIEHEVGVTSRPVRVPKIDSDYFEE